MPGTVAHGQVNDKHLEGVFVTIGCSHVVEGDSLLEELFDSLEESVLHGRCRCERVVESDLFEAMLLLGKQLK